MIRDALMSLFVSALGCVFIFIYWNTMRYIVSSRIATLKVLLMAFFRVSTLR
jgi:hypothetical protein